MEEIRTYILNFGFSLLGYFIAFIIALYIVKVTAPFYIYQGGLSVAPLWVNCILWANLILTIIILFFLGTKLKLLENLWLNYLSAFSITAFLLLICYVIPYLGLVVTWPFPKLANLIYHLVNHNIYITFSILAFLPSIIIWLGMLFQAKRS